MEPEELADKLEKISLPEIELRSHKRKLRETLLSRYGGERRSWAVFNIFQKAIPAGAVFILAFLIFNNFIYPNYSLTKAKEIALQDPQIKELVAKGAILKDAEIIKNRVYVLIQSTEKIAKNIEAEEKITLGAPAIEEIKKEETQVALAEIDVKEKKVTKVEKITPPVIPLTTEEKEKIQTISQNNPEIRKNIPEGAEIKQVITPPTSYQLIKKGGEVQLTPESTGKKEAIIIYQFDKSRWQGKINLSEEKVEEIEFLGEFENNATSEKEGR